MWKQKLKIGCAKIQYLGYQQIGQQILKVYDMHSEWHTAVIKKCQVCLWCQSAIIIHVNTICIGALVTNYLLCLSLQQTGFAIYASWKHVKAVCYEVSYVYTALIEIYYRLEVVPFCWTTRYIKHTYYN